MVQEVQERKGGGGGDARAARSRFFLVNEKTLASKKSAHIFSFVSLYPDSSGTGDMEACGAGGGHVGCVTHSPKQRWAAALGRSLFGLGDVLSFVEHVCSDSVFAGPILVA